MKPDRIRFLFALLAASAMSCPSNAQTPAPPASEPAPALDSAARKAVLDGVIGRIEANYVFPEKAPIIAKALRRKSASGGFDSIADPRAFAGAVNAVIGAVTNDKHLGLSWSPEPLPKAVAACA